MQLLYQNQNIISLKYKLEINISSVEKDIILRIITGFKKKRLLKTDPFIQDKPKNSEMVSRGVSYHSHDIMTLRRSNHKEGSP